MTKIIRLTEGDLHRIIENSVRRVLKEEESRNGKGTVLINYLILNLSLSINWRKDF